MIVQYNILYYHTFYKYDLQLLTILDNMKMYPSLK